MLGIADQKMAASRGARFSCNRAGWYYAVGLALVVAVVALA